MRHVGEGKAALAVGLDRRRPRKMRRVRAARHGYFFDWFFRLRRLFRRVGPVVADAEIDQDRRCDEDRRVGADQHHAEHHDRREAVDGVAAEQQQRQQRQRHRDVGDDRARQRRIDGFVEQLRHRHLLVAPQHFPDPVVDHDGVVQRIAENGQKRRDAGEVEIDLRDRHEADRQHDVVDVGDHGAERELPLEPEPEIDQDRKDREHQAEHAVGQQFAGNARSDHFDATIIDGSRRARRGPSARPPAARRRRRAVRRPGSGRRQARRTAAAGCRRVRGRRGSRASRRCRPCPTWPALPSACRP